MRTEPVWKFTTVQHFVAEGVTKSTIYRIIARYRATGTTKHRKGAGRPRRIMTSLARARLRRIANHRTGLSQRGLSSRFSCSQAYICKVLKQLRIRGRRRMKVPSYKDGAAIREAKKRCRRLCNKFKNFGLSGFQMAGNRSYYTSDKERTPSHVKTYSKKKFGPKVMLLIHVASPFNAHPLLTCKRASIV